MTLEERLKLLGLSGASTDPLAKTQNSINNYTTRLNSIGYQVPQKASEPWWMKVLKVIDTPRNAIATGIANATDGGNFSTGFGEGWRHDKTTYGSQFLDGKVDNKILKTVLGFGVDVALDPLTYASFGLGSFGKGLVTKSAKALGSEAAVNSARDMLLNQTGRALNTASKAHNVESAMYAGANTTNDLVNGLHALSGTDGAIDTFKQALAHENKYAQKFADYLDTVPYIHDDINGTKIFDKDQLAKAVQDFSQTHGSEYGMEIANQFNKAHGLGLHVPFTKIGYEIPGSGEAMRAAGAKTSEMISKIPVIGRAQDAINTGAKKIFTKYSLPKTSKNVSDYLRLKDIERTGSIDYGNEEELKYLTRLFNKKELKQYIPQAEKLQTIFRAGGEDAANEYVHSLPESPFKDIVMSTGKLNGNPLFNVNIPQYTNRVTKSIYTLMPASDMDNFVKENGGLTAQMQTADMSRNTFEKMPQLDVATEAMHQDLSAQGFTQSNRFREVFTKVDKESGGTAIVYADKDIGLNGALVGDVLHLNDFTAGKQIKKITNKVIKQINDAGTEVRLISTDTDKAGITMLRKSFGKDAVMVGDLAADGTYSVTIDTKKISNFSQEISKTPKVSRWQTTQRYFGMSKEEAIEAAKLEGEKTGQEMYIVELDNLKSGASEISEKVGARMADDPKYKAQKKIVNPESSLAVYKVNPNGTDINSVLEDVTPTLQHTLSEQAGGSRLFKQKHSELSMSGVKSLMKYKDGYTFVPRMKSDGSVAKFGTYEVWKNGELVDELDILKGVKVPPEVEKQIMEEAGNDVEKAIKMADSVNNNGIHFGDLGKADYLESMADRGTGHYGTGTYFFGSEDSAGFKNYAEMGRPKHSVSFNGYNLYKPISREAGTELHDVLKQINKYAYGTTKYRENLSELVPKIQKLIPQASKAEIVNGIKEVKRYTSKNYDFFSMETKKFDSPSTMFMKRFGYEGIDVRGIDGLDNSEFGSVIYDLKQADGLGSMKDAHIDMLNAQREKAGGTVLEPSSMEQLAKYGFKDFEDFKNSTISPNEYGDFAETYKEMIKIDPSKMDAATKILENPEMMYSNDLMPHEKALRAYGAVFMDNLRQAGMKEHNIQLLGELLDDYIPHTVSWENQEALARKFWQGGMSGKKMQNINLNSFNRQYKTTIEEANMIMAAQGYGDNYFETNVAKAYLTRMIRHNKVVYDQRFLDRILGNLGVEVSNFNPDSVKEAYNSLKINVDGSKNTDNYIMVVPKTSIKLFGINNAGTSTLNSMIEFIDESMKLSNNAGKMRGMDTKLKEAYGSLKGIEGELDRVVKENPEAGAAIEGMLGLEGGDLQSVLKNIQGLENISAADYAVIQRMAQAVQSIPRTVTKFRDTRGIKSTLEGLAAPFEGALQKVDESQMSLIAAHVDNVKAYLIPEEVYNFVNKTAKGQFDEGMNILTNMVDSFNKFWKVTVTSMIPSFHLRNFFGGMQQNAFEFGMKALHPKFMKASMGIAMGKEGVVKLAGKEYTYSELRQLMAETRVNTPFFKTEANDLGGMYRHEFENTMGHKVLKKALPWNIGREVGNVTEVQLRATNFMAWLDEGVDASAAAERTKSVMFDYTELSDAERKIFKRIMPFYTFFRKNFPYQLENILNRPGQYGMIQHAVDNAAYSNDYDMSNAPEWLTKSMALPLGKNASGLDKFANLSLPAGDAFGRSIKDIVTGLNPLAIAPMELYANKNFLTGAPITRYPGQTTDVGGIDIPNEVLHAMQKVGVIRNGLSGIASSSDDPAGMFTNDKSPLSPRSAFGLIKGYDEKKGELNAAYEQDRELANTIQMLKDKGVDVPTVAETNQVGGVTVRALAKAKKYSKYR